MDNDEDRWMFWREKATLDKPNRGKNCDRELSEFGGGRMKRETRWNTQWKALFNNSMCFEKGQDSAIRDRKNWA